jgi:hypothetical protein
MRRSTLIAFLALLICIHKFLRPYRCAFDNILEAFLLVNAFFLSLVALNTNEPNQVNASSALVVIGWVALATRLAVHSYPRHMHKIENKVVSTTSEMSGDVEGDSRESRSAVQMTSTDAAPTPEPLLNPVRSSEEPGTEIREHNPAASCRSANPAVLVAEVAGAAVQRRDLH